MKCRNEGSRAISESRYESVGAEKCYCDGGGKGGGIV
jgi:hypothetical protein